MSLFVIGLAVWLWSHELQHRYDRTPTGWLLALWAVTSVAGLVLVFIGAITWAGGAR